MKIIIIRIIVIAMLFQITSCDDKLDLNPPHSMVESTAIVDQATAEAALIGAYYPLELFRSPFGAYSVSQGSHMVGFTEGTYRSWDDQLTANDFDRSEGWEYISDVINAANFVIEKTEGLDNSKFIKNRKAEIIAEARFMRFFAQYNLTCYYSQFWNINSTYGSLMRREPARVSNNDYARSTVSETYTLLLEDLDFVIENGPEFTTVYRASKLLAKAYKAEVLLMRGTDTDLQDAITIANEVLNDSKCQKETAYGDIFDNAYTSSELLFTRYMDEEVLANVFANYPSIVRMFGGYYTPTPSLMGILDTTDNRTAFYYDTVTVADEIIVPKLYKVDGDCLPYYMRTSQMELVKAEAYARLNNKTEAINAINTLRPRAGKAELDADTIANNELATVIYNEIVKEIALEKSYEWFAAIRLTNTSGERLIYGLKPEITSVNQFIWPIPQKEEELNGLMIQNPGYEGLY